MLGNVAVVVYDDGVAPFEPPVLCEAWGVDRSDQDLPVFDFAVCSPGARSVPTSAGFTVQVAHDLDRVAAADLVAVPAVPRHQPVPDAVVAVLRAAYERGARVMSVCSGAFALGAAGLLDGRECTTHWRYADAWPSGSRGPGWCPRCLRRRRPGAHERRHGGRPGRLPAPVAQRVRRAGGQPGGAPDGGPGPARRRSGAVHPERRPRVPRRDAGSLFDWMAED